MNPITLLALLAVTSGHSETGAPPVLTVCEAVRNLGTFRNRTVIVVGVYAWTFEGGFLSENCPERDRRTSRREEQAIQLAAAPGQAVVPDGFVWDRDLLQAKLKQAQIFTKAPAPEHQASLFGARWIAVLGTLRAPSLFRPPRKIGDTVRPGNGYGVDGSVPARLLTPEGGEYAFPTDSGKVKQQRPDRHALRNFPTYAPHGGFTQYAVAARTRIRISPIPAARKRF